MFSEELIEQINHDIPFADPDDYQYALQQYYAGFEYINISKGVETSRARTRIRLAEDPMVMRLKAELKQAQETFKAEKKAGKHPKAWDVDWARVALKNGILRYLADTKSNPVFIQSEARSALRERDFNSTLLISGFLAGPAVRMSVSLIKGSARVARAAGTSREELS